MRRPGPQDLVATAGQGSDPQPDASRVLLRLHLPQAAQPGRPRRRGGPHASADGAEQRRCRSDQQLADAARDHPHRPARDDHRGSAHPAGREYTVTTSQTLVEGVHSLFQAIWGTATDLNTYLHSNAPRLDADGRMILQALASGLTDASAAKQLGISLRTYRRRVADLMAGLKAESRFQAGLRAGEMGISR
ncbi:DNA-binding response regulator [Streptomyces sp. NPDC007164]|uniref:helix-turn-helix transcriptional regulator n=1 Tax=Streptomyces sp. NPDC007164 TaxID=3156918 RepID=UPI00340D97ED